MHSIITLYFTNCIRTKMLNILLKSSCDFCIFIKLQIFYWDCLIINEIKIPIKIVKVTVNFISIMKRQSQ